jgi:hypothetical protein
MIGIHFGVQTRIKELFPSASYIYCCSHNLNLMISNAVKSHSKIIHFFDKIQAIFNFFASSAPLVMKFLLISIQRFERKYV